MRCPHCKKRIPDHSKYCPYDGTKISVFDIFLNRLSSPTVPTIIFVLLVVLFVGYEIWMGFGGNGQFPTETQINKIEVETFPTIILITVTPIEETANRIVSPQAVTNETPTIPLIPTLTPEPIIPNQSTTPSDWNQGKLAYVVEYGKGEGVETELYVIDLSQNKKLEIINRRSGRISAPDWSPDGSKISVYINDGGKFLNVVDAKSSASPKELTACGWNSWSSDGNQIACKYEGTKNTYINFVDSITRDITESIGIGELRTLDWSPVRDEFVISVGIGYHTQIWRISADGKSAIPLTGGDCPNFDPNFSSNGERIVYRSNCEDAGSEIWIMNRDGGNKQRITFTEGWSDSPDWSPDGNYLAFVSSQADSAGSTLGELFIISLIDGTIKKLTNTGGRVANWGISWGK